MCTTNRLYSFQDIMTSGIYMEDSDTHEVICKTINRISIPMIQRPYAQGRKSQEGLRKLFLKNIFDAITNPELKHLQLNFIYGTFIKQDNVDGVFELLDGQQRLTTLFLLHYFFANQESNNSGRSLIPEYLQKFQYQTRTTTTDFIKKLLNYKLDVDEITKPSKVLRSAVWYSTSFDKDTTIDAMIRMLDSIHSFYYQYKDNKPSYQDLNKIRFYVLELSGFGLTEELFIKMNARGLQLTPFESFKADLIGYMKKVDLYKRRVHASLSKIKRDVEYWLNFSSLLDSRWSDLFWETPTNEEESGSKECDIKFYRFIQRFFLNKSILLAEKNCRDDDLVQFFNQHIEVERYTGFEKYAELIMRGNKKNIDLINQLEQLLDFMLHKVFGPIILNSLTAPWEKEHLWQPWGAVGNKASDVGQRQMIILSAMTEYINNLQGYEDFDAYNYLVWMRFVHVMTQRTDINGFDAQITLTKMLNEIITQKGDDMFDPISNPRGAIIKYTESHRDNRNLEAEALKARLIVYNKEWEEAINEAEKDPFMQGSCTFYYKDGMEIQEYKSRTEKVSKIFGKDGVVEPFAIDYKLLRAVLCRNYDWSTYRKNFSNFRITNSGADRYLRTLTIWNNSHGVKDFFYNLLDKDNVNDMMTYINEVIEEDNDLILRNDGYWTPEAKERLIKVYKRLYKETEFKAMKWLYGIKVSPISCYFYRNGNASLYVGYVNCMFLGIERHKYIPKIVDYFKDSFDFNYMDSRQIENYEKYNNYSGDDVRVKSDLCINGTICHVIISFHSNESLTILVSDEEKGKIVFNAYKEYYRVANIKDYYGNDIQDINGNLSLYYESAIPYYRVNYIQNVDRLTDDELICIIQILYNNLLPNTII